MLSGHLQNSGFNMISSKCAVGNNKNHPSLSEVLIVLAYCILPLPLSV